MVRVQLLFLTCCVSAQTPDQKRRVDEATRTLRLAVQLNPRDPDAYAQLAHAYQELKFLRAASQELNTAVALAPAEPEWRRQFGALLGRVGDSAGAMAQYQASLALRPTHGETYYNLGNGLRPDDLVGKQEAYATAIALSPTLGAAYVNLASIQRRAGLGEESLGVLRSLLAFEPLGAGPRLTERLRIEGRPMEATAVHLEAARVAATLGIPPVDPEWGEPGDWRRYVAASRESAASRTPKCLDPSCISGLERGLTAAAGRPGCAEALLHTPADAEALMAAVAPQPTLLRAAIQSWPPIQR